MNTILKGTLFIFSMIALILPLMTLTEYHSKDLLTTGERPTINVYTLQHTAEGYDIAIRIQGLSNSEAIYIYQIYINNKVLPDYDSDALVNGVKPSEAFPIKITPSDNTLVILSLKRAIAGQFIELKIETSVGLIFYTMAL